MDMKRLLTLLLCLLMVLAAFPAAAQAEDYVTVTFDANGGCFHNNLNYTVANLQAPKGGTSTKNGSGAGEPSREDYDFVGWYLTADGSGDGYDPWNYTPTYQEDTTFYAKWKPFVASGTCGETLSWSYDKSTGTLTITGSGAMDDYGNTNDVPWRTVVRSISSLSLPDGLTTIGDRAFYTCTSLTSVTIPNSVTSVGWYTFASSGLTSLSIPSSVTFIDDGAFSSCTGLTAISVSASNQNYVAVDGVLFTKDMTELITYPSGRTATNYTVPNGVRIIHREASSRNTALTSLAIPDTVTTIGMQSFPNCSNLENLTLGNGVTSIEAFAFQHTAIKQVTIPKSVTHIESTAFSLCDSLTSINVETGNQYYTSEDGVLLTKDKTELVAYPAGKQQENYVVPQGIATIGDIAFWNCSSLQAITIPVSVTQIEWHYGGQAPATATPTPTPAPTPTPTPAEAAKTVKVQAKKSVKLQAPKAKGNSYQWYQRANRNAAWTSLGKKGAKDKLSVKATMALDGYQYRCRVTSLNGTVTYTDIYELYVYEPLKVKKQPKWGKASLPGSKMTLSVTAQGADSYQWVMRPNGSSAWTMIEGATAPSYVVNVQEGMAGYQFACRVSGRAGSAQSKAATVKMVKVKPPKVSKQPAWKKAVKPGDWVTLSIKAQNADTYQWYYRTSAKGAWILFSGETKPALTFQVKAGTNGYQYKCTVKGKGGTVDSKPVTLKVVAP